MAPERSSAFAVWITGLPASGKSTLASALKRQLATRGVDAAILESDELRKIFTPEPRYDEKERDTFYRQIAYLGALLVSHGTPVIFDATANRRAYRQYAREQIPQFLEVYVDSPLQTCMARDPKGIYRQARGSEAGTVPGLHVTYEIPESPDVIFHGHRENAEHIAEQIVTQLIQKGYFRGKVQKSSLDR